MAYQRSKPFRMFLVFVRLLCLWSFIAPVLGSTPNVILRVDGSNTTWLAKRGEFGSDAEIISGTLVHSPDSDLLLCGSLDENNNQTFVPVEGKNDIIMLAPRGECTFERKAFAAKTYHGAVGLLIYDTISARYRWNETTQRVIFPSRQQDYECDNGYGSMNDLDLDPPQYNGTLLDPLMDMKSESTNCSLTQTRSDCDSQICLVTSHVENSTEYPVCCAWDTHITMQGDDDLAGDTSDIVSVFLTIRQSTEVLAYIGNEATVEERPDPSFDASMIILWLLGTAITANACFLAAKDYRLFRAKLARYEEDKKQKQRGYEGEGKGDFENPDIPDEPGLSVGVRDGVDRDNTGNEKTSSGAGKTDPDKDEGFKTIDQSQAGKTKDTWVLHSLPPPESRKNRPGRKKDDAIRSSPDFRDNETADDETLPEAAKGAASFEMTQWHVFGFVVSSSILLFLLFYFRFYNIVTVFYALGCAGGVSYYIFGPALVYLVPKLGDEWTEELNKSVCCGCNGFDVTSQLLGFVWAIVWSWYGLSHYRPSTNAFFWITVNIFGACFCTLALTSLKLSNVRIAALLMISIFLYDVFFVFLTPLFLDGQSVMTTVARGGASGSTADDFCFKYPEDRACTGVDFLPMILIVPQFNSYNNGSSLLGLGDIVLPGFLIAFGARVDEAARVVGKTSSQNIFVPDRWYQEYFFWLMVAYGFGLFLAFLAFSLTGIGQPALLYIVPAILGALCIVGRRELKDLWNGPQVLHLADKLVRKCEKTWGRQRMKRQVEKRKRERELEAPQVYERQIGTKRQQNNASNGRSTGGHDATGQRDGAPRGGRGSGRGRGRGEGRTGRGRGGYQRGRGNGSRRERSPEDSGRVEFTPDSRQPQSQPPGTIEEAKTRPRQNENVTDSHALANYTPELNDVCIGDENHQGTKDFRKVVRRVLKSQNDSGRDTSAYKVVLRKMKRRKFLQRSLSGNWKALSRTQVVAEIEKAIQEGKTIGK